MAKPLKMYAIRNKQGQYWSPEDGDFVSLRTLINYQEGFFFSLREAKKHYECGVIDPYAQFKNRKRWTRKNTRIQEISLVPGDDLDE